MKNTRAWKKQKNYVAIWLAAETQSGGNHLLRSRLVRARHYYFFETCFIT